MKNTIFASCLNRRQFIKRAVAGAAILAAGPIGVPSVFHAASPQSDTPPFKLPPLPYRNDALIPYISAETIGFHHGKHHQGYVDRTNRFIQDTAFAKDDLEAIVRKTAGNSAMLSIFNNAAQAWNHTFYWKCMKPNGGGVPTGDLAIKIISDFGSLDNFKKAFTDAAATQFGSGWAWLVAEGGSLKVIGTGNADTPLAHGLTPLITIDVWEHAYYLDYQNRRGDYIAAYLDHLVDWDFAAENFAGIGRAA